MARKITKEICKQMKVLHQHFLIHWKISMLPHYQIKFCGYKIQNSDGVDEQNIAASIEDVQKQCRSQDN